MTGRSVSCAPSGRCRAATTGAVAVLTVAFAFGLSMRTAGEAHAAGGVWNVASASMPWVPTTASDGEISFALVNNSDESDAELVSYRRDGSRVQYASRFNAVDLAWSPGGDEVVTVPRGSEPTQPAAPTLEHLSHVSRPWSSLWSPHGDSTVSLSIGPYQSEAQWVARDYTEKLAPTQMSTPGAGAVTPNGTTTVVSIHDSAGALDLGAIPTTFPRQGNPANDLPVVKPTPLGYSALSPQSPAMSNDGTLAFVGTTQSGPAIYVDEGHGPVAVAQLGELCPAQQRPTFAPSGRSLAYVSDSGGCKASELHVLDKAGNTFVGGTDSTVLTSAATATASGPNHFANPSWRPRTPAAGSTRLSGRDRIATGIAVSRWGWSGGSHGAVIASSESFPDALVAGPLSGAADYPLLVTRKAALDSRVLTELKRLMPMTADRFVYIVGGAGSVSEAVRTTLAANGFQVVRLAGRDRFETSVAVAQDLDRGYSTNPPPRTTVVLADGISFPDALSAGPVATMYYGPVLLTNKTTVPTVVRNYVNNRSAIRTVHAIGGDAAQAVGVFGTRAGERIVGADRFDTSAKVAQRFFAGATTPGYANGLSFPDALTGGALMSAMWQPLVLVQPGTVPAVVGSQATLFRPSTDEVLTFGGTAVVSEGVRTTLTGYAGTQSAVWGPDVPQVDNPLHATTATAPGKTLGRAQPSRPSPSQRLRPVLTGSTFQNSLGR